MNNIIGQPVDRVDGRLKVTGGARYAAEFPVKNLAHGFTVQSTITSGSLKNIDTAAAEKAPGVLLVMTHKNAPKLREPETKTSGELVKLGEKNLLPLQSDTIFYDGQHIAVVVAETFEQAQYAASLIKLEYAEAKPVSEFDQAMGSVYEPRESFGRELQYHRGDAARALGDAEIKIQQTYVTPVYHHNPMEPHATIAEWQGDQLILYDSTQSVLGNRNAVAQMMGIAPEKVRLVCLFTGGGFGCKGFTWPHTVLAPMAAKLAGRPVKIVLTRQQMFTCNGRRGKTIQDIGLGATKDGRLTAVRHVTTTETSFVDEFIETAGLPTRILYACPNLEVTHKLVRLNRGTPTPTRAPGEAPGTYALEVALDELAYQLKMDPVELRNINYADINPETGQKWSGKNLKECYRRGAEAIGWSKRNPQPGSMRDGEYLVGYGMATAIYPGNRTAASAKVRIFPDGHAVAASCTQEIGTGTYTIMTQIAAEALGLPVERVEFKLGDSDLPRAPVSGGSQTTASVGPAVRAAALTARSKVIQLAIADKNSPLKGQPEESILAENGRLFVKDDPGRGETYAQILSRHRLPVIEAESTTEVSTRESKGEEKNSAVNKQSGSSGKQPEQGGKNPGADTPAAKADEQMDRKDYAFQSFGAQFAKVRVDPVVGKAQVVRCVAVMDVGRVMNLKTAKNQIMGGMVFGIGMALMEETVYDPNRGRIVTRDLANYHVPVHADMPVFEVQFLDEPDPHISPLGARGIGEIGITGITAAIANAIYHATGKRIRELPITPDKLI